MPRYALIDMPLFISSVFYILTGLSTSGHPTAYATPHTQCQVRSNQGQIPVVCVASTLKVSQLVLLKYTHMTMPNQYEVTLASAKYELTAEQV